MGNFSLRWVIASVLVVTNTTAAEPARPDTADVERQVVHRTNAFRAEHRLGPLATERRLQAAARYFAEYMATTGKFEHDADGQKPAQRIAAQEYRYCMVAENIAYEYSSRGFTTADLAKRFVEDWKGSSGHRANMLNANAVHTAVAIARAPKTGYYYAVQLFGSPRTGKRC